MINKEGLTEVEIDLIQHLVDLESEEIINGSALIITGKEADLNFDTVAACLEGIFGVDADASANAITKFKAMSTADKSDSVIQTKQLAIAEAQTYLNKTDWYVVREADTGTAMPSDVKTKRAEARTTINNNE